MVTEDIDALWAELNAPSTSVPKSGQTKSASTPIIADKVPGPTALAPPTSRPQTKPAGVGNLWDTLSAALDNPVGDLATTTQEGDKANTKKVSETYNFAGEKITSLFLLSSDFADDVQG